MKKFRLLVLISLALLALNSRFVLAQGKSALIDKPAPAISLLDPEGKEINLSDFKGKVVLVDFWATWCGPCMQAMPFMQALHEDYKEKEMVVIGVNSWERNKDKVGPVLKSKKITYKILLDPKNEVIGKYGVKGIPTFFIIDKKGVVRYSYLGMPADRSIIRKNIDQLLAM